MKTRRIARIGGISLGSAFIPLAARWKNHKKHACFRSKKKSKRHKFPDTCHWPRMFSGKGPTCDVAFTRFVHFAAGYGGQDSCDSMSRARCLNNIFCESCKFHDFPAPNVSPPPDVNRWHGRRANSKQRCCRAHGNNPKSANTARDPVMKPEEPCG